MAKDFNKTIIETVSEYQEREEGSVVMFATSRGSMNYGLYLKGLSDYDSIVLVLPSWDKLIMGTVLDNQQILDKDTGTDIYAMDLRNIEKLFYRPNFPKLQMMWALHRYSYLSVEFENWLERESLTVLQKNLKPLALASLGRYRHESKGRLTDKELSLHLYNFRLIELLISKKDLTFKEFKQFALTLGTNPYPKTHVSLFDLKFQGTERAFFEEEVKRSSTLIESVLPELPILTNGCEEIDNLKRIVEDIVYTYLEPQFIGNMHK